MSTPYHAKYFAYEISRHRTGGTVQQLTHSLFDACVDLNPHQIEASLFAIESPLSQGAILADEVGLGKTIEAGLLLCQYWAERKRKLLIICPASLRKQWSNELIEKFHLPNKIIDRQHFQRAEEENKDPFDEKQVYLMSIHFAARYSIRLRTVDWDLVVIDEAHKLRNVFRKKNKMAQSIKWALQPFKKILLTATPIQNSLLELFGLAMLIDEHYFGDVDSFRRQFINTAGGIDELRRRITVFCHRTRREQVTEYIRYTRRRSITTPFYPTDEEQRLYDRITEFIHRKDSYSIPSEQRHLMILVLRKILASSRFAITRTLKTMLGRLLDLREGHSAPNAIWEAFIREESLDDDLLEAYDELPEESRKEAVDPLILDKEIKELQSLIHLAETISVDTKSESLLKALDIAFHELEQMGARRKVVVFTESRRTQEHLAALLRSRGFRDTVVTFNGTNTDPASQQIYRDWLDKNRDTGKSSGSKAVDMRWALVDYFREKGEIFIATEAAAEGINLQFASLLINYDLPWNPQRIEQRIGRCHRYGQQFDVVVMNFLNKRNETDCRVYELLDEKLDMFNGVFGASDEILGQLEDQFDIEGQVLNIYNACRSTQEIEDAFNGLRREMEQVIENKMQSTKQLLLKHFDRDVHSRLKVNLEETREHLDHVGRMFWQLTRYELDEVAEFDDRRLCFNLSRSPLPSVHEGAYHLVSKLHPNHPGEYLYRLAHPLGEYVIGAGKHKSPGAAQVYFDYSSFNGKITPIGRLSGQSGWMLMTALTIDSFEPEDYLVAAGLTDKGKTMDPDVCKQFFQLRGAVGKSVLPDDKTLKTLQALVEKNVDERVKKSAELNREFFKKECEKLDQWADDRVLALEKELWELKTEIRTVSMQARLTEQPSEQHKLQVQVRQMEKRKRELRQRLFQSEDDIGLKRNTLIDKLDQRKRQTYKTEELFVLRWTLI